jgi:hypothetical protein
MKNAVFPALALVMVLTGCDGPPPPQVAGPEIRGEPIRQKPAPAPAAVSTAANSGPESKSVAPEETAYPLVGFDSLAGYPFEVTDDLMGPVTNDVEAVAAKSNGQIPASVRALNRRPAAIKGFMLPLKVEGGLVTELLIMKDQSMCCYGVTPKINEWVSVKMTEKGVKPMMDQPVTLMGKLHVGEMRENGYLIGIYRMDGEKMEAPE